VNSMKKFLTMLREDNYTIFLFHGVIDSHPKKGIRNYNRKHVLRSEFDWLIKNLMLRGNPIDMRQLLICSENGETLPRKSFSITFDDGFLNNHKFAAPILKKYNCPATFYLASSFVCSNKMSWVDRIEHAVDVSNKKLIKFNDACYTIVTQNEKINFMEAVRKNFKSKKGCDFDNEASKIQKYLIGEEITSLKGFLDEKMTWKHVRELCSESLFNIGGHSHSHGILSHLTGESLNDEVRRPIEIISRECSIKTKHFSYPEGLEHHFNFSVIKALRQHGVCCCPTAIHGFNDRKVDIKDLFRLKRVSVV
jgi:peptidoglycan/xylan/chitin deacetylase (PgdA/CDA1 family)